MICSNVNLPPLVRDLLLHFRDHNLTNGFVNEFIGKILNEPVSFFSVTNNTDLSIENHISYALDCLFPLDSRAENFASKNFGQAILDLNGDFIWVDQNSEKLFEIKLKDSQKMNLFKDLMIPMSQAHLSRKFNGLELFKTMAKVGTSCTFSYVLYSLNSVNKFIKTLQSKNIKDLESHSLIDQNNTDTLSNYYKYLKALSSKATLIAVSFDQLDLTELSKVPRSNISLPERIKIHMDDKTRSQFGKRRRSSVKSISKNQNEQEGNTPKIDAEDDDKFYQLAILLETRNAKSIPAFPYQKMENDPQILLMKEKIKSKLN